MNPNGDPSFFEAIGVFVTVIWLLFVTISSVQLWIITNKADTLEDNYRRVFEILKEMANKVEPTK